MNEIKCSENSFTELEEMNMKRWMRMREIEREDYRQGSITCSSFGGFQSENGEKKKDVANLRNSSCNGEFLRRGIYDFNAEKWEDYS